MKLWRRNREAQQESPLLDLDPFKGHLTDRELTGYDKIYVSPEYRAELEALAQRNREWELAHAGDGKPFAITTHIRPERIAEWLRLRGSRDVGRDVILAANDHLEIAWRGIKYEVRLVHVGEFEYYDVNMFSA